MKIIFVLLVALSTTMKTSDLTLHHWKKKYFIFGGVSFWMPVLARPYICRSL